MGWRDPDFITHEALGIAYRKAKVDLYYERGHANLLALLKYEENLSANLRRLYKRLNSDVLEEWMTRESFVGKWSVIAKSLDAKLSKHKDTRWRPSDPDAAWSAYVRSLGRASNSPERGEETRPVADFRLVGVHPIDMHVVGALWMLKVGHLYDAALGPEAYGSRLRATDSRIPVNARETYTNLSLGSFRPYFEPFRKWRDNGLAAIRKALGEGKRVVAITADARQFYHRVSPDFLLHPDYLDATGLQGKVKGDHRRFTQALIGAVHAWASGTPLHARNPERGLPVGYPAARLIANVALTEFDRAIVRDVAPLYYGRYVDDVLLVLEDTERFTSQAQVWRTLIKRTGDILKLDKERGERSLKLKRSYLETSDVRFAGDKQKTFLLEGNSGKDLVGCIERQVRERSSEWRSLPDLPDSVVKPTSDAIGARGDDGEEVDNLRRADALSARRAAFAMRLRDAEAFSQDLPPVAWAEHRRRFFATVMTHVLSLPSLFDYDTYLPRLVGLAVGCGDYEAASALLDRLDVVLTRIVQDCDIRLLGQRTNNDLLQKWRIHLTRGLVEACAAAIPLQGETDRPGLRGLVSRLIALADANLPEELSHITIQELARRLFRHDLGRIPYRFRYFPYGDFRQVGRKPTVKEKRSPTDHGTQWIHDVVQDGVRSFLVAIKGERSDTALPLALAFPTRPFLLPELFLVVPELLTEDPPADVATWTVAFRGTGHRRNAPKREGITIDVPLKGDSGPVRVALTSWYTSIESWKAAVVKMPDPDSDRYSRMNRLLNEVLACPTRPRYLVLPELAVPPQWFIRVAIKLASHGISLVSGVEYLHPTPKKVANQVWASLVTDFQGYRTFIVYRQDKQRAAVHEESELWTVGGKRLAPLVPLEAVPRIRHGDFFFSILVCSELTDVAHRAALRGQVDAIVVPEWNQDTDTFSSLVESAAADVHAYIIQCNHRDFGDTRIRGPARASWKRDIVRVKGGVCDYFVVGELDVEELRRFQSHVRSPSDTANGEAKFKPVPDGFRMSPERRRLPG